MNCCPRPSAFGLGQQFIGSSTAPRGDSYDCHKGRFEIVVLLPNSNLIPYAYYFMTRLVVTLNVLKVKIRLKHAHILVLLYRSCLLV